MLSGGQLQKTTPVGGGLVVKKEMLFLGLASHLRSSQPVLAGSTPQLLQAVLPALDSDRRSACWRAQGRASARDLLRPSLFFVPLSLNAVAVQPGDGQPGLVEQHLRDVEDVLGQVERTQPEVVK
jgi:hypothetical protein